MVSSKSTMLDVKVEVDVRETMRTLPNFMQPMLTWLTGKPFQGQQPLIKRSKMSHYMSALFFLFFGASLATVGILNSNWWSFFAIPFGWILTVGGARKLATSINHYCVHGDFMPLHWKRLLPYQSLIAEVNSIICFLQCFADYRHEHMTHHKAKCTATMRDPDMVFMWLIGFKAGMSRTALWRNFYWTLFRPSFHYLFLKARFNSNFRKGTLSRKLVVGGYLLALTLLAAYISWKVILFAWVFPLTILYHIAALMQFCSEHRWLKDTDTTGMVDNLSPKERIVRAKTLTLGRFSGETVPNTKDCSKMKAITLWIRWLFKMLLVHLPTRLFVLSGDLPQHDWHHRAKKGDDWANAVYERQLTINNLASSEEPFREVWGLRNAIDGVFVSLSKIPPIQPRLEEKEEAKEVVLAM